MLKTFISWAKFLMPVDNKFFQKNDTARNAP